MKLIDDWKNGLKFWSVRLGVIGTIVASIFIAVPDAAIFAWNLLPLEFKSAIPERYMPMIGVSVFFLSMIARFIKQTKLHPDNNKPEEEHHD